MRTNTKTKGSRLNAKVWNFVVLAFSLYSSAFAQGQRRNFFVVPPPATSAPAFSPTNIAGVQNLSWWVADNITGTNSGGSISNWADAGASPMPLTNLAASTSWPVISNSFLNGHAIAHFDGVADYMKSVNYTSAQPHEVIIVANWWGASALDYYFDGIDATKHHYLRYNPPFLAFKGGTDQNVTPTLPFNQWWIIDVLFNGTSSGVFTNNVSIGPRNAGTVVNQGIVLGAIGAVNGYYGPIDVAEVLTYGGTLGTVDTAGTFATSADRTAIYSYLTNKYNIAP